MALSKIDAYVFGGPCAHFVTAFNFSHCAVTVEFKPIENDRADGAAKVVAVFANAVIISTEEDPDWDRQFPLDPIGFDAEPLDGRWEFVLQCDSVEWIWESEWPALHMPPAD